jgi:tRNA threonylcarbamoyladenosine biosynthesis protein TsaB
MALILSLETSASLCSVALHSAGELIDTIEISEPQAHAAKAAVSVQQLLQRISISMTELKAVAISSGPGSYTGLRIGTSLAKGICFGLNIPLIDIPTLNLLAHHMSLEEKDKCLCPMIDARRMEVYAQVFDRELNALTDTEAVVITENSFNELLDRQAVLFFGDGSAKCRQVLTHANAYFVDGVIPRAKLMGQVAYRKFMLNHFADLAGFTPFYFKEFVAKKAQPIF